VQVVRLRDQSKGSVGEFGVVHDVDKAAAVGDFGKRRDRRVARR
jgi:hypothetical protein